MEKVEGELGDGPDAEQSKRPQGAQPHVSPLEARTRGWGRPCPRAVLPGQALSALCPEDCTEGSGQVWRRRPLTGKAV